MNTKKCKGECPKCGNDDIDMIGTSGDDELYQFIEYYCNECETEFEERYKMEYVETIIVGEENTTNMI